MKLNNLKESHNITAYGFAAFKDYATTSNPNGPSAIVSTLSPAIMADMGINVYFAPILPRGAVYNTADDVAAADLDINMVTVFDVDGLDYTNKIIVSRHQGTIDILQSMYPDAVVLSGNVTPDDIRGCLVVGTLPPHLIQYCSAYRAATITDFDYAKDGDLSGQELEDRLHISEAICVEIKEI